MAIGDNTRLQAFDVLIDLKQRPNLGVTQTLISGKEDQVVTLLRTIIAFSQYGMDSRELETQICFYKQNLNDFATVAQALLMSGQRSS